MKAGAQRLAAVETGVGRDGDARRPAALGAAPHVLVVVLGLFQGAGAAVAAEPVPTALVDSDDEVDGEADACCPQRDRVRNGAF